MPRTRTEEPRYTRLNTCRECFKHSSHCNDTHRCEAARKPVLRQFDGLRLTADGFDCALPVTVDSHSMCSYGCLYCFSDNLMGHRISIAKNPLAQTSLSQLEAVFSGKPGRLHDIFRKALKYDDRNKHGYPCPIQVGGLCDPLDNIERNQGWFLKFVRLCIKYEQPARISTKGNLFLEDEYLKAVAERPELFWVAFSINTIDDEIAAKTDRYAPLPSERLECMRRLSSIGVTTSLRMRPIIPGISDSTPKHPYAYAELIEAAARAGAKAISYEVAFVPGSMTSHMRRKWQEIEKTTGIPIISIYKQFGKRQSCTRPAYTWTEEIMHEIKNEAKKHGLWIGISDPVWKQLGEHGCCCGIPKDHPVFGNWQRHSATNRLLEARDTGKPITLADITPPWAHMIKAGEMCKCQAGPEAQYARRHMTWADKLRELWNDADRERNPITYFQGAIKPVRIDENGDLVYIYKGLERQHKKAPYWHTRQG